MTTFFSACVLAYLIGSLSSALILTRMLSLEDPRLHGSGNAGTTNVLRQTGWKLALFVLIGDMLKGLFSLYTAHWIGVSDTVLGWLALVCMIGHIFPIFFHGKGGKGVATFIGGCFGLSFKLGFSLALTWMIVLTLTRYASLASISTAVMAPLIAMMLQLNLHSLPLLVMAAIIVLTHRDNIQRLLKHEENQVNWRHKRKKTQAKS